MTAFSIVIESSSLSISESLFCDSVFISSLTSSSGCDSVKASSLISSITESRLSSELILSKKESSSIILTFAFFSSFLVKSGINFLLILQ